MKNEKEQYLYNWLINLIDTEQVIFKYKTIKNSFNLDIEYDIEFYIENLYIRIDSMDNSIIINKRETDLFTKFENKFDLELNYIFTDVDIFKKLFTKLNSLHHKSELDDNKKSLNKFIGKISEQKTNLNFDNELEKEWNYLHELSVRSEIATKLMQLQDPNGKLYLDEDFIMKNILNISDSEIEENINDKLYSLIKVDKKDIEYMNNLKLDSKILEYVDESRIDGNLIYKINIPIIDIIKKIE